MRLRKEPLLMLVKNGLGDKIRQSVNNLVVDVWGLENRTANSLNKYFDTVCIEGVNSKESLAIHITNGESLTIGLFFHKQILSSITLVELLQALNIPITGFNDLDKLSGKIRDLFKSYVERYKIMDLNISVKVHGQKVQLQLIHRETLLEAISFNELINRLSPL